MVVMFVIPTTREARESLNSRPSWQHSEVVCQEEKEGRRDRKSRAIVNPGSRDVTEKSW